MLRRIGFGYFNGENDHLISPLPTPKGAKAFASLTREQGGRMVSEQLVVCFNGGSGLTEGFIDPPDLIETPIGKGAPRMSLRKGAESFEGGRGIPSSEVDVGPSELGFVSN